MRLNTLTAKRSRAFRRLPAGALLVPAFLVVANLFSFPTASSPQSSPVAGAAPELVIQTGHSSRVNCIALAPNNRWLASGGADSVVKIWDIESGLELRALSGHAGWIKSLAISNNGEWIASGSNDRTIRIWNVGSGIVTKTFWGHAGPVEAVAFSPDDRILASGSADNTIKIWDLSSGKELQSLKGHTGWITSLTFSPEAKLLVSGSADRSIKLWNTSSWAETRTLTKHADSVTALAFSADGNSLATAGADGKIFLWPRDEDRERFTLSRDANQILALIFRGRDELLSTAADGSSAIWTTTNGKLKQTIPGAEGAPELIFSAFSRDGNLVAASSGNKTIELRSVEKGDLARVMESDATGFYSVAFSPNGRWLASGANDRSIRLWQTNTGRELPRLVGHRGWVTSVDFSPDNRLLASGSISGEVLVWQVSTGRELYRLPTGRGGINSVSFSPDGKSLAYAGGDHSIRIWNLDTKQAKELSGHSAEVTTLAWQPDSSVLASGSSDKTVRLWEVATGKTKTIGDISAPVNAITFGLDGRSLFVGANDHRVIQLDAGTGRELRVMKGHEGEVLSLTLGRNGSKLASASADRTVILWDTNTGRSTHVLKGANGNVNSVDFSADGQWLLSGSDDGSMLLWNASSGALAATLISRRDADGWLVATPDGLFDGSPESWNKILWRFDQNTFSVVPVESFFSEFYYPGLLANLLTGKTPKATAEISNKDRRQPQITMALAQEQGSRAASRQIRIKVEVVDAPPDGRYRTGSGVNDLRLFRNGLLVNIWPGDVLKGSGRQTIEATVPIVAGENRFVAYAFNRDNVKTADATISLNGAEGLKRVGTAYIIAVGVGRYANSQYNLNYSVADAIAIGEQLRAQQEQVGRYRPIEVITLLDEEATKANVLTALNRLSGRETSPLPPSAPAALAKIKPAQPEDAVVVYFSGHGTAQRDRFYLIPHDLGYQGSRTQLDGPGLQSILSHSISDEELEEALRPLDADQLLLVIDACNSGQALEAEEKRRGPMNTKGLAQLAYEKGMYVLTASQSVEVAFESEALKHSYLAYALVEEGIKGGAGDTDQNGELILREWFNYAADRVPRLGAERNRAGKDLEEEGPDEARVQRPRIFYTRDAGAQHFIVARIASAAGR